MTKTTWALEMQAIGKEFPGVKALSDVTLQVEKGEIHALVGENGAGKSTLMKVLSGFYPHGTYSGNIRINGEEQRFRTIQDSEEAGVAIIYQELALVRQLSVAENIFLGSEIKNVAGVIDWGATYTKAARQLATIGLNISPTKKIGDCGVGEQQLVEIAKALAKNAKILILDEPTAALTESESLALLDILRSLKQRGVTCIYISHRLHEVLAIADRVTVLRDGRTITTMNKSDLSEDRMVSYMVGREINERYPKKPHTPGQTVLELRNWTVASDRHQPPFLQDINLIARQGEILGIAGLMGSGRTELAMSLFGVYGHVLQGQMLLSGKKVHFKNMRESIEAGMALVSEDRKRYGLVLGMNVAQNTTLANLTRMARLSVIDLNREVQAANDYVRELRIKTPSIEQKVGNLSGGNQQKVVLAKWLLTKPRLLIIDEPTRGIDVGAKFEIYNLLNRLVDEGVAVIMISSDLAEVLGMSDRILVMHEGSIRGELSSAAASQEAIMQLATATDTDPARPAQPSPMIAHPTKSGLKPQPSGDQIR